MAGFHGFPNRFGKKQLSKIGVKTKVPYDCFFTENEPKCAKSGPAGTPLRKTTESRQPIANLGD